MTDFVHMKIVASLSDFSDAMEIRKKVFVDEQKLDSLKEFDGNDFGATHLLACVNKKPVGTMRIRYFNGFVKFERICVLPEFRKSNVSEVMMQTAAEFCALKGYQFVHGVCKKELLSRWAEVGAFPIKGAKEVTQNGMTLVPIEQRLPKTSKTISMTTPLDILNRKEGEWFENVDIMHSTELGKKQQVKHFEKITEKVRSLKYEQNEKPIDWNPPLRYDSIDIFRTR